VSSEELVKLRNENARLKEALKDSQEFIDTVADAAYEIFWRTDEKHRMVYMSPRVVSSVDIAMEDQLGKTRAELADDDLDSTRWKKHLADLDGHRPYENFCYTRKRSDGDIRHITSSGRPVFDGHGKF
jgi:PAS domain-containing protein